MAKSGGRSAAKDPHTMYVCEFTYSGWPGQSSPYICLFLHHFIIELYFLFALKQDSRNLRMQSQFQELVSTRSRDRLLEIVEDEPELLSKILQMYDQGVFHRSSASEAKVTVDPTEVFPRGETRHGGISLKNLMWLFEEALQVPVDTVKNIAARVKLQGCRWLWFWVLEVDPKDALTGKSLEELKPWVASRYRQSQPELAPCRSFLLCISHQSLHSSPHPLQVWQEAAAFRVG